MEKITFCINTAKNEKDYIALLLGSLFNGIDIKLHDILIFVDSDNQDTTELLKAQKDTFPNLKIIKNKTTEPWSYQVNINYMFDIANTDIVSYLQSDMVVSLKYDEAVLKHLTDKTIVCSTRVEPPLHAQYDNEITYVRNFGLTPDEFLYDDFLQFSEEIKNPWKTTNYFFAPFTLYKKLWNDIGGHDTKFRWSREDSDILYRFCLSKYNMIQCWDAIVYHFTCTSSRGIDWWKNKEKQTIQLERDKTELDRFCKKWGQFKHPTRWEHVKNDVDNNPSILNNICCKNPPYKIEDLEVF